MNAGRHAREAAWSRPFDSVLSRSVRWSAWCCATAGPCPFGSRALDLLVALIERRQQVVTKSDLLEQRGEQRSGAAAEALAQAVLGGMPLSM